MDARELRAKYRGFARWYDVAEALPEALGIRRLRRLLAQASGRVLEVAAGTGKNFRFYRPGPTAIAVDLSREMLEHARRRRGTSERRYVFAVMDAEWVGFRDRTFDTVISTLSTLHLSRSAAGVARTGTGLSEGRPHLIGRAGRSDRPGRRAFRIGAPTPTRA